MNRHILTRGAVVAALAFMLSACDQGLSRVNVNPNGASLENVTAGNILPTVEVRVVSFIQFPFGTDWMDWAQQSAQIQYPGETVGQIRPGVPSGNWSGLYASDLKNIDAVIQKGVDGGYPNIQAVGMIWKAFTFSQVTDMWGYVPYSQALQGASEITPAYDSQQDIYKGMIANLVTAYGMLGNPGVGDDFGGGDLIYGSDFTEWKKFDASLRMRLAMRLSEVDPATAQADFVAAYNDGGFTSNADNAQLPWAGGNTYGNPMWNNYLCGNGGRDDNGVSKTFVDTLLSLQDPRIAFYAEPTRNAGASTCAYGTPNDSVTFTAAQLPAGVTPAGGGFYNGLPYNGRTNGKIAEDHGFSWYSRWGDYWRANGETTPSQIMDYSEVLFLEAEAALRGWISANPATLYTEGITAAFQMYEGVYPTAPTAADLTTYLANPRVVWAGGALGSPGTGGSGWGAGMKQIQLQKWISLWMVGMEAWSNWRRVRVPNLMPGPDLAAGFVPGQTIIPVREPYPADEQTYNNTNLQAAIAAQGGGLLLATNVWWDVNSNAYE